MSMRRFGVALVVVGLPLLACSEDEATTADLSGVDPSQRNQTSELAATTNPVELRDEITALLASYDGVRSQILPDPGVAADRDDPLIQEYLGLFEPDNEFVEQVLDQWADNGEAGISLQQFSADYPAFALRLDGEVEVVSDDEVRFPWCETRRYRRYDGDGGEVESVELGFQGGTGVAVRVDGGWRLRQMDAIAQLISCRTPEG